MVQPYFPIAYSETFKPSSGSGPQNPPNIVTNQGKGQGWQQPSYMNRWTQIVHARQPVSIKYENYKSRQSFVIGIGQIIVGVLCIAFNVTLIAPNPYPNLYDGAEFGIVGHGIWGGAFFIISGSFGIGASKTKSKCMNSYPDSVPLAMNILLVILGLTGGIIAIWGSVLCCKVACCCALTNGPFVAGLGQVVQRPSMSGNQQAAVFVAAPSYVPLNTGYLPDYLVKYSPGYTTIMFRTANAVGSNHIHLLTSLK